MKLTWHLTYLAAATFCTFATLTCVVALAWGGAK